MKKMITVLLACGALFQVSAAELNWLTDLPKAEAQAKAENKLVLLDFTGSDWCPGCILFHDEAALSPKFAAYAKASLVLVQVDFPDKKPQSDALKATNDALQKKYDVEGFPTFILLNQDGKELGRQTGYSPNGMDDLIIQLGKLSKK
jgi:thioredoxin-related protein